MERILNGDEKIRRAEEIYYRRKLGGQNYKNTRLDNDKKRYLGSKILLELLIIINLSLIIICVQNKEYIFTTNFISDLEKYNFNLSEKIRSFLGIEEENSNQNVEMEENIIESPLPEKSINSNLNINESEQNINNVSSDLIETNMEQDKNNVESNLDVMSIEQSEKEIEANTSDIVPNDEDIMKVSKLVKFEKPIKTGTITSRFGIRESIYKNVSGYHTGIDIGATKGTSIYSAMSRKSYSSI